MAYPTPLGVVGSLLSTWRLFQSNLNFTVLLALPASELLWSAAVRHLAPLFAVDLSSLSMAKHGAAEHTISPVELAVSCLSFLLPAYLAAMARSGEAPCAAGLLRRARGTWWRPVLAAGCARAFLASSLLALAVCLRSTAWPGPGPGPLPLAALAMAATLAAALVETWGVVGSVVEGEVSHGLKFAWRRKGKVLALMAAMMALEAAFVRVSGLAGARHGVALAVVRNSAVGALVSGLWRFYQWLVYVVFYESHQKHDKGI